MAYLHIEGPQKSLKGRDIFSIAKLNLQAAYVNVGYWVVTTDGMTYYRQNTKWVYGQVLGVNDEALMTEFKALALALRINLESELNDNTRERDIMHDIGYTDLSGSF